MQREILKAKLAVVVPDGKTANYDRLTHNSKNQTSKEPSSILRSIRDDLYWRNCANQIKTLDSGCRKENRNKNKTKIK